MFRNHTGKNTGRLITWNYKHIHTTSITSEEYLCKQIKKSSGRLEDIFLWAVPKEMHYSHQQDIVNTTKETLMGQSVPSKSGEGKVEESIVTHDIADKCQNGRKVTLSKQQTSHVQQAHTIKVMKQ